MGTLVVFAGVAALVYTTTTISTIEVRTSRRTLSQVSASAVAETGVERARLALSTAASKTAIQNPLQGILALFGGGTSVELFDGAPLEDNGGRVGAYSVTLELVAQSSDEVTVRVRSSGYVPDAPWSLGPNERLEAWDAVSVTLSYSLAPSGVFDYGYFINNWGWFYGNTIACNGNARSNGQFDAGGYTPTVGGQPTYDSVAWDGVNATLSGYQDDNGDGLSDGGDGGVFSGWDIVGAGGIQGVGGQASNQHDFEDQVEMPNLSDMSMYETQALTQGSNITIGGVVVADAVTGDDPGEMQNLYLVGTAAEPIVLNGPIVVRGDVIISGYVTGQGAIYSSGNVYVPKSVQYLDPPSPRPAGNAQTDTEAWLSNNWDKDFLGLFSAENIVVGNYTNSTWSSYVGSWMGSSINASAEDAGEDGIPNTLVGRDGVAGTSDDDVLEGDGIWTVEYYSADDLAAGLIPSGFGVGDPIPGSGEDIDGDGTYDATTTLADLTIDDPLDPSRWAGNMPPAGIANYGDISSLYANQIDAVLYTNHSYCHFVLGSQVASINGALISRNENIVYGTPRFDINYDCRLLGGNSGMAGPLMPKVLQPPVVLQWRRLDEDPHRAALP